MAAWRVNLSRSSIRRLCLSLAAANGCFTAGTALFIHYWARRDYYGPTGRLFIDRVLVQAHLGTENVVAAWYSSMLLLAVAAASALAFVVDRRVAHRASERIPSWGWLIIALTFVTLSLDEIGSFHERLGMIRYGAAAATGWVYVLLVPIALVGLFMLAFTWARLRQVPAAAVLFVAGTVLFLSDPLFEFAEMSLLRGGADGMFVHNMLLVIEEGVLELGGAFCFLAGVLVYLRGLAGEGPYVVQLRPRTASFAIAVATMLLTAAIPASRWFVDRLPAADTGIPENWFPSAALFALWLCLVTHGRRRLGVLVLALSACFGAGLFGYVGLADARMPMDTLGTVITGSLITAFIYRTAHDSALSARRTKHQALSPDC
jgi:hypothetical protein